MAQKHLENMYPADANANLIVKNAVQIEIGIMSTWVEKSTKTSLCKKYAWNLSICTCENCKYLEYIIDNSMVTCDEIKELTKTIPIGFNDKTWNIQP